MCSFDFHSGSFPVFVGPQAPSQSIKCGVSHAIARLSSRICDLDVGKLKIIKYAYIWASREDSGDRGYNCQRLEDTGCGFRQL